MDTTTEKAFEEIGNQATAKADRVRCSLAECLEEQEVSAFLRGRIELLEGVLRGVSRALDARRHPAQGRDHLVKRIGDVL